MFDERDYDDTDARFQLSTIPAVRDAALILYGRFVSRMNNRSSNDEGAKTCTQHLSLQETEAIVREHSYVVADSYAIGGNTKEEAKQKIKTLLAALMDRIMSNVLQEGVRQDLLDCRYDVDKNDFTFSVTDKGKQTLVEHKQNRDAPGS